MPTGYTHIIEEGATFEQFVWRCARGMSPLIMMREEPFDARITPEKLSPSSHYTEQELERARQFLYDLERTTIEEAGERAAKEYEAAHAGWQESKIRAAALAVKYRAMREKVATWKPPTPDHDGLQRFMLDQIDLCKNEWTGETYDEPAQLSAADWLSHNIGRARRSVEHHTKQLADDRAREEWCIAWLRALTDSVPMPDKLAP